MPSPLSCQIDTAVQITGTFANSAGAPTNPTAVSLYLRNPLGARQTITGGSIGNPSAGVFTYQFTPSLSGPWVFNWQGTGTVAVTLGDTTLSVLPSALISG